MINSKTTKRLLDIPNGSLFEIEELTGWYKLSHVARIVEAYDSYAGHCRGIVRGLYESLEAGRWTIKC